MAGPYDSLGFEIASVDDVRELALSVLPQAAETRVENGAYARWAPGGGEELWFRLDRDGELVGAHAHFSGSSRLRLSLEQRVRRRGESPLGGGFLADVIDEEGDEWCQLVFDGTDPAALRHVRAARRRDRAGGRVCLRARSARVARDLREPPGGG